MSGRVGHVWTSAPLIVSPKAAGASYLPSVREQQKVETRKRLFHSAMEVFCREGVSDCRIEGIARAAGVSRAAFYFHFPSKDDVLVELLVRAEAQQEVALTSLPAEADLHTVVETLIQETVACWGDERRNVVVEAFSVTMRRTTILAGLEGGVRAALRVRFEKAASRHELSSRMPAGALADFYLLNLFAAAASWGGNPVGELVDRLRGVTSVFLNGAKPVS